MAEVELAGDAMNRKPPATGGCWLGSLTNSLCGGPQWPSFLLPAPAPRRMALARSRARQRRMETSALFAGCRVVSPKDAKIFGALSFTFGDTDAVTAAGAK